MSFFETNVYRGKQGLEEISGSHLLDSDCLVWSLSDTADLERIVLSCGNSWELFVLGK